MDLEFDVTCPKCKRQSKLKVKQMVPGASSSCPYCHTVFRFTGDDGRKAQKALDDFEKTIKNISIKLK
jgi:ssDNA-binding Zn-finger/Zn-ribbon topoisomerase 1